MTPMQMLEDIRGEVAHCTGDGCSCVDSLRRIEAEIHEECGAWWSSHDNANPLTSGAFGCPTKVSQRAKETVL